MTDVSAPPVLTCLDMQFPLDKAVLPPRVRKLLRTGAYEAKEAEAAQKLIRKGDVVMELGGGIGFMSTLVATKTPARAVHAFEANPALIPYIRRVHALNGAKTAQVTHAVLSDGDGTAPFYVRPNFLASSLTPMAEDGPEVQKLDVPMRDMNQVMADLKPTVLICDIEGAEVDVLPKLDLSSLRAVLIETHPQWIGKEGIRKVFHCLDAAGLVFFPRWSHGKVAVFRSDW
ncbi:FkbM family methyltransferase [Phaeobacter sp. QD34_3]|uniref:FkbM family methyltransferase n=1 Tax=unclassified Phaeobacter TaxID=2621772 RepID=UPI00237F2B30|nr:MULTISPECIES: FkbM family methyltransferase [unclassified Phaeobacter]MDE4133620.1 FkbM family methyltransferase [Phaeobacter sp. QD34_3]MDE4137256.1 FkbM family methyltransferase [Phaeobacter sp. QD34_24]